VREREAVPARGEDVREQGEGGFVRGARGKGQGVEVGEGDAQVLRLEALGLNGLRLEGRARKRGGKGLKMERRCT